jgi:ADP-heptose:LPS heptosyltransferase
LDKKNILVFRFSALGDVAMIVPVIAEVTSTHEVNVTIVTKKAFIPLFAELENVTVIAPDFKKKYRGVFGLWKLFRELKKMQKWDVIIDIHNVLRTKVLCWLFKASGFIVYVIKKNRTERKKLTRKKNKKLKVLSLIQHDYAKTFGRAGFSVALMPYSIYTKENKLPDELTKITGKKTGTWIGIAPFAKHKSKIYPLDKMEKVVEHFSSKENTTIFLFGGGKYESEELNNWETKFPNTYSLAGKISFENELRIMAHLDCMLSMDSSNMHLANLVGIPVISVWGATHPYAGFFGHGHSSNRPVQLPLDCRPCSVYGNKPCYKGTYECLNNIEPEMIIKEIEKDLVS